MGRSAMTKWRMKGQYLKNCSCLASCPCDTIGVPAPNKFCEGVVAMNVKEGNFDKVKLDGVKWAATVHWPGALHEGNGTLEAFIDEGASAEQRDALIKILTGQAGGTLFEILKSIVTTMHGPHFVKIDMQFDKAKRRAKLSIPGFVETTSGPLVVPPTGEEQRVIVNMPNGFEYKEMEVAFATTLKSTGAVKFNWQKTHSSLAEIEHTQDGLVA
ncbi:MAG: DUF1326 domain-containing protein [Chloroflexi bacterium]|nr:MAG: DUF1326 domain-containing protein [Chloroflexota bacterium]